MALKDIFHNKENTESLVPPMKIFDIVSIIDTKEESDIDSLFSGGGTSALMSNISGLDDFELICFLVVK